jgi:RNA polymerase sigma-70 factor (ECF subfamily)
MSLQHRLPDPVVRGVPQTSIFQKYLQQTRIAFAAPDQEKQETRACEGVCGSQETIDGGRQRIEETMLQPSVRDVMLAAVPSLRAFAISLSGNVDRADDLVQGTLVRAIGNIDSFQPGTNMLAWLFTILRNQFRSEYRKRRREVEDADGSYIESLTSAPGQHGYMEFKEVFAAVAKLPLVQREALLLVGASGFSYDEAAAICGTPVGTIKSRTNRARTLLAELLGIDKADEFGQPYDRRGKADESDRESPS